MSNKTMGEKMSKINLSEENMIAYVAEVVYANQLGWLNDTATTQLIKKIINNKITKSEKRYLDSLSGRMDRNN